ncbi:DNA-processing protein DprA [bacterium]|nr:DNA-processing protein DprA [bacterium]
MIRIKPLDYWLALTLTPGIGVLGIARAFQGLGSVEAIFKVPVATLISFGVRKVAAEAVSQFSDWSKVAEIKEKTSIVGGEIIPLDDPRYPRNLKQIVDPPPVLFVKGSPEVLKLSAIAVVGARRASELGRRFAFELGAKLAGKGLCVVSGMALGVDGAAHEGCLRDKGPTIAVLGTGLDVVYPAAHRHLSERIAEFGLLMTELPPGSGPDRGHFPRRNRIVSGLAQGVVVVEAGEKSGSLITARLALEQGREVFAVPGPPGMPGSKGVNRLLKDGAQLLESVDDIFLALPWLESGAKTGATVSCRRPALTPEQSQLLAALGPDEINYDDLLEKLLWGTGLLSQVLLELELSGLLMKSAGNNFRTVPEHVE